MNEPSAELAVVDRVAAAGQGPVARGGVVLNVLAVAAADLHVEVRRELVVEIGEPRIFPVDARCGSGEQGWQADGGPGVQVGLVDLLVDVGIVRDIEEAVQPLERAPVIRRAEAQLLRKLIEAGVVDDSFPRLARQSIDFLRKRAECAGDVLGSDMAQLLVSRGRFEVRPA